MYIYNILVWEPGTSWEGYQYKHILKIKKSLEGPIFLIYMFF